MTAPEEELLVRWVQQGIFQARFSIHSASNDNTVTEPWMFKDSTDLIRSAILLRYRIPTLPPPSPSRTTPPPRARARWSPPRRLLRQHRPQARPRPQLRCIVRPRNMALMVRPRLRHRASRAARPAAMPSPRSNSRSVSLHSKPYRASRATAIPTTPITRSRRATAIRSIRPRSRSRTTATRLPASPVRMARMLVR